MIGSEILVINYMNKYSENKFSNSLTYRPDIDGLRAIAVLLVIAYHYFPKWVPGGFIGVDVFFVISGYLISRIIFTEINIGSFSIVNFYFRRVRRIFPALILVLLFGCIAAWQVMLSNGYMQYGKHMFGGALFIDNFLYFNESNYFDGLSLNKTLLHLWSLGIEEQFYILWPIGVLMCARLRKGTQFALLGALIAVSFFTNVVLTQLNPIAAFYLPLPRFWELLMGSIVAYVEVCGISQLRLKDGVKGMVGLACIVALLVVALTLNERAAFPGWWALLPVLSSLIIIIVAKDSWLNYKLLANRYLVAIGLISYPLYLWHWVLLSLAYQVNHEPVSSNTKGWLLLATVALSIATYQLLERPLGKISNLRKLSGILLGLMGLIAITGLVIYSHNGYPDRGKQVNRDRLISELSQIQNSYTFFETDRVWRYGKCYAPPDIKLQYLIKNCVDQERPLIVLWGDSYAASFYSGLEYLKKQKNNAFGIAQITNSNGPPFFLSDQKSSDWKMGNRTLEEINHEKLELVRELQPEIVILTWRFDGERAYLGDAPMSMQEQVIAAIQTINKIQIASKNTRIVIIGPYPHWKYDLRHVIAEYARDHGGHLPPASMNYGLMDKPLIADGYFKEQFSALNISYISAIDILCSKGNCLTRTSDNAKDLITVDYGHLSESGAHFLVKKIQDRLLEKLN